MQAVFPLSAALPVFLPVRLPYLTVSFQNNTFLYHRTRSDCKFNPNNDNKNEYFFEQIPYEIGQKLNIEVLDEGGSCFLIANVRVDDYDYVINTDEKKFWKCDNCEGNSLNQEAGKTKFLCYPHGAYKVDRNNLRTINYYFQINSILDLPNIHYYYYLNENNYFRKYVENLNGKINLIDLHLIDNLYAKNNNEERIFPFYEHYML